MAFLTFAFIDKTHLLRECTSTWTSCLSRHIPHFTLMISNLILFRGCDIISNSKVGHKAREAACIIPRNPARNVSLNESFSNECRVYKRWMLEEGRTHFFSTLALHSICAADNRGHIPHILFNLLLLFCCIQTIFERVRINVSLLTCIIMQNILNNPILTSL